MKLVLNVVFCKVDRRTPYKSTDTEKRAMLYFVMGAIRWISSNMLGLRRAALIKQLLKFQMDETLKFIS